MTGACCSQAYRGLYEVDAGWKTSGVGGIAVPSAIPCAPVRGPGWLRQPRRAPDRVRLFLPELAMKKIDELS
jgi:hypothetical protein